MQRRGCRGFRALVNARITLNTQNILVCLFTDLQKKAHCLRCRRGHYRNNPTKSFFRTYSSSSVCPRWYLRCSLFFAVNRLFIHRSRSDILAETRSVLVEICKDRAMACIRSPVAARALGESSHQMVLFILELEHEFSAHPIRMGK